MNRNEMLNRVKVMLMDPADKNKNACPVFYSSILFSLKLQWTDQVPTAGVDGKTLFINEAWFCAITLLQAVGLLAHEVLHIALRHLDYFVDFNLKYFDVKTEQRIWNIAADHVINLLLIKAGYHLPPGGCYDDRFKDMSTLQVYKIIHAEHKAKPSIPLDGGTDIIYLPDGDSAKDVRDLGNLRAHITDIIMKAAMTSSVAGEHAGSIPGGILRELDELINPKLPFEVMLTNYMTVYANDDYSYATVNRRYLPEFILPGSRSEHLCNLACIFDASGSVTEHEFSSYANGVRMIMEQLEPEKITLVEFDTQVRGVRDITQDCNIRDIDFNGGGGTQIGPVIDWIAKNKPEVSLIFTDGDFNEVPMDHIKTDIIWVISNNPNFKTKYGKVFHYQI